MVQFSVHIQDYEKEFAGALEELRRQLSRAQARRVLFHVYSTLFSEQSLSELVVTLREQFDGCQVVCGTVFGAVMDHDYHPGIVIAAQVFERETSRVQVCYYDLERDGDRDVAGEIARFVRENPWVKAIEGYRTTHDMNTADLCDVLSGLPEEVIVFGGLAGSKGIPDQLTYLCDQEGRVMSKGSVAVYYGGDDLNVKACRMSGWKPINRYFTVTRVQDNIIMEIDGAPAADVYRRYLDIEPDEHFTLNALEFPLLSEERGRSIVRNAAAVDPNGGIAVASNVPTGAKLRICYADAESIAEDIRAVSRELMEFTPDVISVVSCVTRSMIWRMKDYMPELQGFRTVAPCYGYLSYGELIREEGVLDHHNTILVAAAFREGGVKEAVYPEENESVSATIPLAARLSTFISRITDELSDMYSEAEHAANTDALTQIGNRYRFDEVIRDVYADVENARTKYLLMFDLNGLKFVNDTFGHNDGDDFIRAAADAIKNTFSLYGQCFRVGGDEFCVIADFPSEDALQCALKDFNDSVSERNKTSTCAMTLAVGYSPLIDAQGKMLSISEWRATADINMYRDKAKFHCLRAGIVSESTMEFIRCIVALLDNKNPVVPFRPERVQKMSVAIGKLMNMDDERLDRLTLSAYLHDLGKLGLDDWVMSQVDPFSDEAREALFRLPGIGRRLLRTSEETKGIADIVYAAFERWDGSGFPEGIRGEDIPLEARIASVAYFIDTSMHEAYGRRALSMEECAAALRKYAGSFFDPAVVGAVLPRLEDVVDVDTPV